MFPQKGKIFFHEKELTEKNFKDSDFKFFFRKEVAFLFQNSDVQLFCSTVEDELAFTVVQLGFEKNEIQKRVLQCAEMFNLN
ncbi:MAG: ABC transporter ATP-binding protein, partial [Acidobacteria bacterium]|nr:ABC transporter ATP-binding protein [Acidobacteriota bacterium]